MKKSLVCALTLMVCVTVLSACSSKKDDVEYERDRVSTIPWTKPANWEGGGALGGGQ